MSKEIILTPVRTTNTESSSMISPNTQTLYAPRADIETPDEYGLISYSDLGEFTYTQEEIDNKDAETLRQAKEYADDKDNDVLQAAKDYADAQDVTVLDSAKEYSREQDKTVLDSAKEYTYSKSEIDSKDSDAVNTADLNTREYTYDKSTIDSKDNSVKIELTASIDSVRRIAEGQLIGIVFNSDNEISSWLSGDYVRPDGISPTDLVIGQHIYNRTKYQNDYWVSTIPVTSLSDLSPLPVDRNILNANDIVFDSSITDKLSSTDVQGAIDELSTKVDNNKIDYENFVYEHAGYEEQIDYNAILENNVIKAILDESVSDISLYNNTTYLIHIYLPLTTLTGELDDSYTFKFSDKNGNEINLNTIFQDDITSTATVGNMCQIQTYDIGIGYSWTFRAHYKTILEGSQIIRVFVTDTIVREINTSMSGEALYEAINNSKLSPNSSVLCLSDFSSNGTEFIKGHNYKIIGDYSTGELLLNWEDVTEVMLSPINDKIQILQNFRTTATQQILALDSATNELLESDIVKNEAITNLQSRVADLENKTLENKKLENNSVLFTITADKWQDLAGKEPYKFSATLDCDSSIKTTGEPVYELINNNPVNFANYGFALINVDFGTSSTIYVTPKFTFYAMEKPTESVNLRVLITAKSVELIAQVGGAV